MRSRDKIDKRKKLYITIAAIGFAALIVLAFTEKYMSGSIFRPLLYGALALLVAGNILLYVGIRCPKCGAIIGYMIVFSVEKIDQCPRCRVMFDEKI